MHAELALLRAQLKQAQEAAAEEASRAGKAVQAAQAGTEAAAALGKPSRCPIIDHLALPRPTTVLEFTQPALHVHSCACASGS